MVDDDDDDDDDALEDTKPFSLVSIARFIFCWI